jgi:hypothetical protein
VLCFAVKGAFCVNLIEKHLVFLKRSIDSSLCLQHFENGLLSGSDQHTFGVRRAVEPGFLDKLNPAKACLFENRQEILSR